MEIDSVGISPEQLGRKALLVSDDKDKLKGTYVLEYINWGEKQGFHNVQLYKRVPTKIEIGTTLLMLFVAL